MIFHPAIISLLVGSAMICAMLCYSAYYGVQILRGWDIRSGSELQLNLERRTYLISTLVTYAFVFQLFSLFLFIYTTDHMHALFVGAMCAAGSLYAADYGYATLILKIVSFLLAGLWLIINATDNRAHDYPIIKVKYIFLLLIAPLLVTEMILQARYFFGLNPAVITSCCGVLFTADAEGVTSGIVALPAGPVSAVFYASMALLLMMGVYCYLRRKGAYLFSLSATTAFIVSIVALISFISLYFYELPTHHCPFDLLQGQYNFVGYPLYAGLLGGTVTGMGVGVIGPFQKKQSLAQIVPALQRRLTLASLLLYSVFVLIVAYGIIFSKLTLQG